MKKGVVALLCAVGIAGGMVPATARDAKPTATAAKRPPNVLLIMADDLAPRLGNYGGGMITPHLDRLARQGVAFDRAYTQFPLCGPSRASFLTGTRPGTTKVMDLTTPFRRAIPDIQTLPQYFRTHGYFSGRVGKIFHQGVPSDIGTSGPDDPDSWDQVINPRGIDRDLVNFNLETPGIPFGSAMAWRADDGPDNDQTDGKIADAAIEMIRAHKDKPFFIGVGFYRPHVPEAVPKKYFDLYPLDRIKAADQPADVLARALPATKAWAPDNFGMTTEQQRRMIRAYSAATSFMDAQVGRVLAAVEQMGLADDTIIVFTSDHGYLLGEHGQWMKNILWEENDKVPLIIRVPGNRNAGKRSKRVVEMLDIYPTLTALAGLPAYARNEGQSLQPLLVRPDDPNWTKPALSQVRGGRSVRTARFRYTEWEEGAKGRELYDHDADPREWRNLADDPAYAATVAQLRALLPPGPVEKRPMPGRYDPVAHCLNLPAATVRALTGNDGKGPTGGDGAQGLIPCAEMDP